MTCCFVSQQGYKGCKGERPQSRHLTASRVSVHTGMCASAHQDMCTGTQLSSCTQSTGTTLTLLSCCSVLQQRQSTAGHAHRHPTVKLHARVRFHGCSTQLCSVSQAAVCATASPEHTKDL
eukprot:1158441-Pelagomonas_calceolata.AAC.7